MHQMVDGCVLPAATPSATPVRTARDPGTDLDRDYDGLIDITTAQQLILMSLDPNGNGKPMEKGLDYAANANFNETGLSGPKPSNGTTYHNSDAFPRERLGNDGTTNGCPESKCVGYELLKDIDLSGIDPSNPLGALSEHKEALLMVNGLGNHLVPWQTVLEGNGYRILGLNIGNDNASSVGFIRDIGPNGVVRNLGFVSPRVRGDSFAAELAVNPGYRQPAGARGLLSRHHCRHQRRRHHERVRTRRRGNCRQRQRRPHHRTRTAPTLTIPHQTRNGLNASGPPAP